MNAPTESHPLAVLLTILLITLVAVAGCMTQDIADEYGSPIPIIVRPNIRDTAAEKTYIMLKLPYGLIIQNMDYPPGAPLFCFFDRDQKNILKTSDAGVILEALKKLPDGATIDMISKCTVPFYSEYGINIDEEYNKISELLDKKKFVLINSLEEDDRHASFCYCEGGFTILDEPKKLDASSTKRKEN